MNLLEYVQSKLCPPYEFRKVIKETPTKWKVEVYCNDEIVHPNLEIPKTIGLSEEDNLVKQVRLVLDGFLEARELMKNNIE